MRLATRPMLAAKPAPSGGRRNGGRAAGALSRARLRTRFRFGTGSTSSIEQFVYAGTGGSYPALLHVKHVRYMQVPCMVVNSVLSIIRSSSGETHWHPDSGTQQSYRRTSHSRSVSDAFTPPK